MGAFHVFLEFAFFQFMSNHTSALASTHKSLPKPMMRHQILEAIILPHVCLSVEDSNVRNRMKRILTKFQPEQSHPLEGKRYLNVCQHIEQFCVFGIDKPNVGNRLKRILAKFEAEAIHVRAANDRSKFPASSKLAKLDAFLGCHLVGTESLGDILWKPFTLFGMLLLQFVSN